MRLVWATLALTAFFCVSAGAAEEKKTPAQERLERRQKVELLGFFMKDAGKAELPGTPMAVQLYNKAVELFQKNEYELARQTLKESLTHDELNPLAYELLGDIEYFEQNLTAAKAQYEIAYNLEPREGLREKLEKLKTEEKTESKLATYREEHFLIKYHNREVAYEGFELRELLRQAYRAISQDLGYYFRGQVVVLLYDENDFKEITGTPHWVAGLYDGKVRMPINRRGFGDLELRALTLHEVTHAFVAAMSGRQAPPWINEGLAQFEENRIKPIDMLVFNAAVKTSSLMSIDELLNQASAVALQDPLAVTLFYQQSFHLVNYLVARYKMFYVKKILEEMGKGKNSEEAIREVLKISTARLEKEWKDTFIRPAA